MIQNLMDGILTGSIISLGAIGLTMVMHMLRFANFAYAELLAIGAYAALVFDRLFAALVPVMDQSFVGLSLTWSLTRESHKKRDPRPKTMTLQKDRGN